jgi:DNA uptake protein ComE-like DNA-binding protein
VLAASGEERLDLTTASESDLIARCKLDADQAKTILDYIAEAQNASMASIISQSPQQLLRSIPGIDQTRLQTAGAALSAEQLALLLDECSISATDPGAKLPGKLNINTCRAETLEYIPEIDPVTADAIILERAGRPQGFTSIVDLLEVPGMSRRRLSQVYQYLTVRSNVYTVTSRGRDAKTGLEVEMTATLDRSSLPVVVSDLIVR